MNSESSLEYLKSENEDPLSLPPFNQENSEFDSGAAVTEDGSQFKVKTEPELFHDMKYSHKIDTAEREHLILSCKEEEIKEGSVEIYINTNVKDKCDLYFECSRGQSNLNKKGRFSCNISDRGCPEKKFLWDQEIIHGKEQQFQNSDREKSLCQKSDTKTHTPSHTREEPFVCGFVNHSEKRPFRCCECHKAFSVKNSLLRHFRTHTGEKPFVCSDCGKTFSRKCHLNTHSRIHTGEKPFTCTDCDRAFSSQNILISHIRTHTGEKPFKCNDCGKSFSQKGYFNSHLRIHTGEKPFKCNDCGKAFSQKGHLKNHLRIHTGEKPFNCSKCSRSFSEKKVLTCHLRTHTGEKPFKCSDCGRAFSQKSSLKVHFRNHTREKSFKCQTGKKVFGNS